MAFVVTIEKETDFPCEPNQTILEAAFEHGVALSHGCKNGFCGSCKGQIVAGQISYRNNDAGGLTEDERLKGECLLCKAIPSEDITLKAKVMKDQPQMVVKTLPAKVVEINKLTDDVIQLFLQLPPQEEFNFYAGQWINFILKGGKKRAFSIANKHNADNIIELQIRHAVGGLFTEFIFNNLQLNAIFQIEGPHGSFYYQNDKSPLLLVAGGTGIAPIKGLMEELIYQGFDQPVHIFWGVRSEKDIYLTELIQQWIKIENVNFTAVLSEAGPEWEGETGFVHELVISTYSQLEDFAIYMAGPPQMIEAGKESFIKAGLDENKLYYDSFEYSADATEAKQEQVKE